jgi:hypothetical protein
MYHTKSQQPLHTTNTCTLHQLHSCTVHTVAFVTLTHKSAAESTNIRHNVTCNQHSNSLPQTNRLKKSKIAEQYRIPIDFLTKFGYHVLGRTRCRRRPNYRSIWPNFTPTTAISRQRRRLQCTQEHLSLQLIDLPQNQLISATMCHVINIQTHYHRQIA